MVEDAFLLSGRRLKPEKPGLGPIVASLPPPASWIPAISGGAYNADAEKRIEPNSGNLIEFPEMAGCTITEGDEVLVTLKLRLRVYGYGEKLVTQRLRDFVVAFSAVDA